MAEDPLSDVIDDAARAPTRVSADGVSVDAQSVSEIIKAAEFAAGRSAKDKNHCGLTFRQFEPGGCG